LGFQLDDKIYLLDKVDLKLRPFFIETAFQLGSLEAQIAFDCFVSKSAGPILFLSV
jgi:hypothetical protein